MALGRDEVIKIESTTFLLILEIEYHFSYIHQKYWICWACLEILKTIVPVCTRVRMFHEICLYDWNAAIKDKEETKQCNISLEVRLKCWARTVRTVYNLRDKRDLEWKACLTDVWWNKMSKCSRKDVMLIQSMIKYPMLWFNETLFLSTMAKCQVVNMLLLKNMFATYIKSICHPEREISGL